MECGAKKKDGTACRALAMPNGKCRLHGGASKGAPLKSGRYSKFLPQRLAAKYDEAAADAELISVRHEAAVLQAFIANALEELDLDNCEAMWDTLAVLCKDNPDEEELADWARQVKNVVFDGVEEWKKVHRALGYIEQKRKLAETEAKRLKDLEANLNVKEANVLVAAILDSINRHVKDSDARSAVSSDLAGIVHRSTS